MKKLLSLLLSIMLILAIMLLSAMPVFATTYGGTCGDNVNWSLDTDTGVLTISGSGDMNDYVGTNNAPWYSHRKSIKSVNIKNGITSICDLAFLFCGSLTSITIPDSVTSIGLSAFFECSSLTSIILPDSVTSIGSQAFSGCSSLASITIPNSVTSIGGYAFSSCSNLTNITIPDSVTSISDGAFSSCSSLTSITIPDSVKSIGRQAFSGCSRLRSVTIGNGVTSIGSGVFYECNSLRSINIPDSVTSIGESAFYYCISLESIIIPDSVTSIGESAFYDCRSLTSITIPDSVTSIGSQAFLFCHRLTINCRIDSTAYNYAVQNQIRYSLIKDPVDAPNTPKVETKTYNSVTLTATNGYEYKMDNGAWQDGNVFSGLTPNSTHIFYQRVKESDTTYASEASEGIEVTTYKMTVSAPNTPVVASKTYNSVTLAAVLGYEYKKDNDEWQDSYMFGGLNPNQTYTFYQRVKETETAYASDVSTGTKVTTDKKSVSTPNTPKVKSKTHNSVTLAATNGYEYKMDNGEWQDSNVFSGLNPNKTYTFYQRVKETNTAYASESSLGTEVTTNKMSAATPKAPTVASKTTNTVTLTKVTGCEYSKDGKTWQSSNVFKSLKAETEYTFYQRKAETDTSYASDKSVALKVKTMPKESLVNEKGVWYYTVNDQKVNTTTLVNYYGVWYYVEKGKVNWNCNTLCKYGGKYYYVKNGKVDWSCNTLCNYGGTYYYVKNGQVDWGCNTLCNYGGTWYYVKNGQIDWKCNTLCNYGGTWYYVKNGKVDWNCNTLCKYGNTWYYVQKGKVNWNATTLCKYGNTWYYVQNGKVNFSATLRFKYYGTYYNVRNGVVKF